MLEGLVTWVLNNYVGEYLENLNADQLSIALLSGQVELENVPLKKTALSKFDVPLAVRSGIIGKLTLSIPITHMRSEPWILKMSDFLVLLGPAEGGYDASDIEGYEQTKKEQLLEALETAHKNQLLLNLGIPLKDDGTQNQYWGASLVSAVSNNIQLILSNVHIRYEDSRTMPDGVPFNFGVRIQHISIQTTNSQWKQEFVQPTDGVNTFKKLDIKGLSVFWNCHQEVHTDISSYAELKQMLSPESSKDTQFILQPFSMQARMEKNSSKFPLKGTPAIPRFKFDLRPEKINIELSKKQLAQIRLLTREWARFDRARQHRKWRPLVAIKGNAKKWWKFAIDRVLDDTSRSRQRCTLTFLLTRAKHLNAYCRSYRQKLEAYIADASAAALSGPRKGSVATGVVPVSAAGVEDTVFMKQIEHDSQFSYHELQLFRETVFRRIIREKEAERKAAAKAAGIEDDSSDVFEVLEARKKDSIVNTDEVDVRPVATSANNADGGGGLYGWFSGWFGATAPEDKPDEEDVNEANFLQMWPKIEEKDLPPNLKKVEKQIEDEIIDVLNESWDDSTVLRRDNLLAEIVLRLERMIVRFVDEDAVGTGSRVVAMDMRQVASRLQLSPREHRTEISLSVGDMSVQRLKIADSAANGGNVSGGHVSDEEDGVTGIFGFGETPNVGPQLLFAIGRAKEEGGDESIDRHEGFVIMSEAAQKARKPLFQMVYRRMAPRLNVLHELDAKFSSISVIYDEDAIDGLSNLFDTEAALLEKKNDLTDTDLCDLGAVGDTHAYVNLAIPSVLFELRSRRTSLIDNARSSVSTPFASAKIADVDIGISKTEPLLTRLKLCMGSLVVEDMFEKTPIMPLIRTTEIKPRGLITSSLSNSCPDLHSVPHEAGVTLSSSLPSQLAFKPVFRDPAPTLPPTGATRARRRKRMPSTMIDNDFGVHRHGERPLFSFIFVDSKHPDYESKYAKRNCILDADLAGLDLAMNRRSWTMLLDFFGALGEKPPPPGSKTPPEYNPDASLGALDEKYLELLYGAGKVPPEMLAKIAAAVAHPHKAAKKDDFQMHLRFNVAAARVHMTYPKNQSQLGLVILNGAVLDLRLNVKNVAEPMLMSIATSELFIHDATPFYSRMYSERVAFKANPAHGRSSESDEGKKIEINILKYRTNDPELKRDCDMRFRIIAPDTAKLHYVHTHRFFCAIMDFWMHFAELQDQVRRVNEMVSDCEDGQKARVFVDINFPGGVSLVLPLNQFSEQIILFDMATLKVSNKFQLASLTPEFNEQCVELNMNEDKYDCLLENMSVVCGGCLIHEGYRVSVDGPPKDFVSDVFLKHIGQGNFQNYYFAVMEKAILSRRYDLKIGVYRNLSALISHSAPDLTVLTQFEDIDLHFSSDFYCLMRGFLEKNLGEMLIPVPETVPIEVLENPERGFAVAIAFKYITLSFRLSFHNVHFHFLVPENPKIVAPGKFKKFGRMVLHKARISFDCYIDSLSEFDLICESTDLIDTRFEGGDKDAENVFPVILAPRNRNSTANSKNSMMKLMSEAHIMMKKDEAPVVTLVLQNSRIVLILDWLNNAKDFFLLNSTFVPPEEPTNTKHACAFSAPKDGVLTRSRSSVNLRPLHTVTLKITLRESDLILLEQPKDSSSLALVCFTTAVLNLHDQHGVFEGDFEVQRLNLSWCVMSSENSTRCQLSNDFTVTMTVQRDIPAVSASEQASALFEASKSGLGSVPAVAGLPKQKLNFELDEAIVRLSYKDLLVAKCVLEGSINRLTSSFANSVIPKRGEQPGRPPFIFENAFFNAASFCVWFLDDSQGVALPMMRLLLNDVHAEHQVGKATNPEHRVSENINAKLSIGMDYFNQRVFGWEPFIEPWNIDEFSVSWKGNFLNIRLRTEPSSPLDINLTQTLVQQMKHFLSKWAAIKKSLDRDFRNLCIRSRADHLPYLMRNDTGANLLFTTNVEEVVKARNEQRKPTAKWFTTTAGKSCTFEFPTKRLISGDKANELRQLIVRVDGWDEISPVDVDSVGTYFRVTKMTTSKRDPPRARVVVAVTMEPDGRKVVTIRSALVAINELPDAITLRLNNRAITNTNETTDIKLEPGAKQPIPLRFVNAEMEIILNSIGHPINWRAAKQPGDIVNTMIKYADKIGERAFWMCVSIKREHYPEYESVSGHTIVFTSPLTLLNLLPVEIEFSVGDNLKYSVGAGKRLKIMPIDLHHPLSLTVRSEQFRTVKPVIIHRAQFAERPSHDDKRISLPMIDGRGRPLDMYGSVYLTRGGGLHLSFWVPYWIVNRSGIPLIIKQEATEHDAAGQITDHEKAKDRAPLMFSFVDNCPQNCVVRVGRQFERDREYKPKFCKKFPLSAGVQALKLLLEHEQQATLMYDIGVEVRQCTGRYKDTQVVLFTPRYRLYNQSTTQLFVCHQEDVGHPSKHVPLAPKCNLIWHENFEDKRQLCIRRADVAHWSCPFRLDQIGSFHLTMRSQDDTPKFVRVEVALSGASFWVTFTDSVYFPAPIKIQNLSDVPVLYQQASKEHNHYRTICKANSTVEYSWDNLYGEKLLTLQVYENKSHSYDPSKPKRGPPLVYENYLYIRYAPSFAPARATDDKRTEDHDLVMEARVNGKVVLTPMNVADSSQRQLWRMASDGALENVGLNHTSDPGVRRVLDVLDKEGFALMVCPRRGERDVTQRWRFTNDDRLACGIDDMYVEAVSKNRLILAEEPSTNAVVSMTSEGVPIAQQFTMQHQKPGSGMLDVECLHVGPTLVVRITDHWDELAGTTSMPIANSLRSRQSRSRTRSPQSLQSPTQSIRTAGSRRRSRPRETHDSFSIAQEIPWNFNAELSLPSGIGVSLVNRNHEELVYMRLQGVQVDVSRIESTYQLTGHVNVIQADNQLLMTDRWHVLYCQVNCLKGAYVDGPDTPNSSSSSTSFIDLHTPLRPALKLEMNCTPMEHYDAFDCFRVKLCDMCVLLDETLLWKLVQFMQETDATEVVSTSSMVLPPNIEPDMSVPGAHSPDGTPTRRCYFGTLDLEVGNVALTAVTVAKNGLPKDLQLLKRQFNIKLVSFENALVSLPPFRQFHYFETMKFLVESLSNFYMLVLQNQTYNIVVSMDAFGNPRGLVTDVKESFQGLVFEGDISGFVYGLGYGVTKSLSKVASSMSHGVGSLTFDDQHELMRRRMLRMQPASNDGGSAAFSHLCNGVKGLGVGIVGGLTAIMGNSVKGAKKDGLTGLVKGVATGAVDTVTKPAQGFFDLLDGTASALKEVVGSQQLRKSRFAEYRVRLPRVGTNLQSLLPPYSEDLAEAQQELLRINSYSTNETLLDVEVILRHQSNGNRVEQRLLICSEQCLCLKQINDDPATVSQRIIYRYFKNIYVDVTANLGHGLVLICVAYDPTQRPPAPPKLYCGDAETARRICEKVLRAKQLYDHSKRTLAVSEDFDANGVNY